MTEYERKGLDGVDDGGVGLSNDFEESWISFGESLRLRIERNQQCVRMRRGSEEDEDERNEKREHGGGRGETRSERGNVRLRLVRRKLSILLTKARRSREYGR